jgi:site-specific DNA-methyltransferase (adenine-specific)
MPYTPPTVDMPLMLHGDCIELMREMPDASVDVVVADPPSSIDFMNLAWDRFTNYRPVTRAGRNIFRKLTSVESMDAAINALVVEVADARAKLKATRPRTVERRIASAVAKALKRALKNAREALAVEAGDLAEFAGIAPEHAGFVAFMVDVWAEVDRVLKPGGFVCAWALPKTADLAGLALRAVGWEMHDSLLHLFGGGMKKGIDISKAIDAMHGAKREVVGSKITGTQCSRGDKLNSGNGWEVGQQVVDVTAPATDDAKRWDGWHSQLAPGHEQWLLARKPTRLTYARQVLTHCTGGLHVDACRIPRGEAEHEAAVVWHAKYGERDYASGTALGFNDGTAHRRVSAPNPGGSWPRNVLLTCGGEDCPAEALDRQSGTLTSGTGAVRRMSHGVVGATYSMTTEPVGTEQLSHGDSGGASRYFTRFDSRVWYGGKAHRRDIPGTTRRIKHSTHKNPKLMRWLVRLLAATCEQTGGEPAIVLDPFGGSMTTAWACVAEGVRCVTIERDLDSYEQGRARVLSALGSPEFAAEANEAAPAGAQMTLV